MSTAAPHRVESPTVTTLTAEDEQQLRRVVADIAGGFGHDYFARAYASGQPVTELWDALAVGGFVGANVPEDYGGAGMGLTALSIVAEEVAAAGCPLISLIISPAIVGSVLARHGSPEQKDRWLRGIGAGTSKIAFAITEPDAGLNSHRIATTARLDGDRYLLTGSKVFISALDEAEAVLVVARTGTVEGSGKALLSLFVVDTDSPGLTWQPMAMGLEIPESQNVIFFDNVEVGPDRLVGERDRGLTAVFAGLNPERVIIASTSTGIGRYALAKATRYAKERDVWGQPIGSHQGIAHPLAEATMHLEAARLMIRKATTLYDQGGDAGEAGEAANMAKFLAAEASIAAVDQAIEVHGGSGFAREVGLTDMHTLARLFKTVPVSREMILNFVAEHTLGLPKSY
jgi:alkylation response protein AidB-like acyl-CoA dehydrogenase